MAQTITSRIFLLLADAPTLPIDVAYELDMPIKLASTHLKDLYRAGRIDRRKFYSEYTRCRYIYFLKDNEAGSP